MKQRILVHPVFGALGLFLLLAGVSLVFFRGSLLTSDEVSMAWTTRALAERGSLHFEEPLYDKLFTNYGVATPIAGLPMYLVEKILRNTGVMGDSDYTLMPITNTVLFGLLGVLLALMMEGERRWWYLGVTLLAGPMLPASLTFYSEMLSAVALVGLAACLYPAARPDPPALKWLLLGSFVFALAGMTARIALLPLTLMTLFWGWRLGTDRRTLIFAIGGLAGGACMILGQNWALRGAPFEFPYEGQDFTTPLLTGLYGLVLAPERGILVFFPAIVVVLACARLLPGRGQAVFVLAAALTLFSLAFHACFWTWHGGWTTGPRFLLPCLALFAVPTAELLARRRELPAGHRLALYLSLAWSGLLSLIYCRHSAFIWWNQLWGFHQLENQWLFLPQLSLWQAWFEGVPLKAAQGDLAPAPRAIIASLGCACVIISTYPLLLPFRGRLGTDPPPVGIRVQGPDRALIVGLALLAVIWGVHWMAGPRGWAPIDMQAQSPARLSHLILEGQPGTYEGWLDNPLSSRLRLHIKAHSFYWIYVNEQLVLEKTEPMPQHLNQVDIPVSPGLYQIRVRVAPMDNDSPALFHLYWTWGGEGTYLAPAGGEYLTPRPLEPIERFFSRIWRRKFMLAAGLLALLLLLQSIPGRSKAESLI